MWIKNTSGKKDAMLTFATISFAVVTSAIFFGSIGTVTLGEHSITFTPISSDVMAVYLGATFSAYVSRRWTDSAAVRKEKNVE
jgi:hypothetical protein